MPSGVAGFGCGETRLAQSPRDDGAALQPSARGNLAGNVSWKCAVRSLNELLFPVSGRPRMVLKNAFTAVIATTLLAWSGLVIADEYRPDEFLGLDLSKAALSPKALGPPSQFVPGPLDASIHRGSEDAHADEGAQAKAQTDAQAEPKAEPKIVIPRTRKAESKIVIPRTRVAHIGAEKPRGAARTRLARRHSNPLDAQAFDTRVQVWPCKSGGICNWKPSTQGR
jgi:hypothetical protein